MGLTTGQDPDRSGHSYWDQHFVRRGYAYGVAPNAFLAARVYGQRLGKALCLAEGGGRNAVYLAELGFAVTVQDFSSEGLQLARRLAVERGVCFEDQQVDLADFDPPKQGFDLVVAIWMHLPPDLRSTVYGRAAAALKPGGELILVGYSPRQLRHQTGGPSELSWLIEPEQLRRAFAGLEILTLAEEEICLDEGPSHQGLSSVVQFHARRPC